MNIQQHESRATGVIGGDSEALRPEATRMKWRDLYSPEKQAVHDLLLRLSQGVQEVVDQEPTHRGKATEKTTAEHRIATSFFVTGARGSGKTTVMLSAGYATEGVVGCNEFLQGVDSSREGQEPSPPQGDDANDALKLQEYRRDKLEWEQLSKLQRALKDSRYGLVDSVQWLDPLDMEFLPPGANLLTTLLVRVRDALSSLVRRDEYEESDGAESEIAERIRLKEANRNRRLAPPPSLLEEGEGLYGAWEELDELLKKATLMWEGCPTGGDPQKLVPTQIDAAETFARIQKRLREALEWATAELGKRKRKRSVILVLPVDNLDRNAHHVHEILKLVRMVYCPTLWYVIAGTEADLNLFLESSQRRELTQDLTASQASESREGVEKLLSSARRQATSTMLTALPPAHRVEIGNVMADEALDFHLGAKGLTLRHYLAQLKIDWPQASPPLEGESDGSGAKEQGASQVSERNELLPRSLLDLMAPARRPEARESQERVPGANLLSDQARELLGLAAWSREHRRKGARPSWKELPDVFTQAGQNALSLPMRNLVDLWQAAKRWCDWQEQKTRRYECRAPDNRAQADAGGKQAAAGVDGEEAIELVAEMLRRAALESDLPEWASNFLCERVVYRNEKNKHCLDFRHNPLHWKLRFGVRNVIDLPLGPSESSPLLFSKLVLHDFYGYTIEVQAPDTQSPRGGVRSCELEPSVSGWLMLLHDLLNRRCDSTRIAVTKQTRRFEENPVLVQTQHRALLREDQCFDLKMTWTMPAFETFFDFERVNLQWQAFLERELPANRARERKIPTAVWFRFLMTSWVDCVLSVAVSQGREARMDSQTSKPTSAQPKSSEEQKLTTPTSAWWPPEFRWAAVDGSSTLIDSGETDTVERYTRELSERLDAAYRAVTWYRARGTSGRSEAVRRWLENGVLLLQMPEYLPGIEPPGLGRAVRRAEQAPPAYVHDVSLPEHWQTHRRYLAWKRFEVVRDAVRETDAYQYLLCGQGERAQHPPEARGVENCLELQRILSRSWFEAARQATCRTPKAPTYPKADEFDPLQALKLSNTPGTTERVAEA